MSVHELPGQSSGEAAGEAAAEADRRQPPNPGDHSDREDQARRLGALERRLAAAGAGFVAAHAAELDAYRAEISAGIGEALARLRQDVEELSGGNPLATELARQTAEYVDWLQWTLWDLPYLAVALRPDPERLRRGVASCGLLYLSIRVLDDLLDRHFWYRGRRHSLLATLTRSHGRGRRSEGLALLAAMLLAFEGISRLIAELGSGEGAGGRRAGETLAAAVGATRRVLIGLIVEESEREAWSPAMYERLVELKNVDYFRILYAALDPADASPLAPFLAARAALAQKINDLEEHPADEARGQPNLVAILRRRPAAAVPYEPPVAEAGSAAGLETEIESEIETEIETILAADFLRLGDMAAALPPRERAVASVKLAEQLAQARRLGLFRDPSDSAAAAPGDPDAERHAEPGRDAEPDTAPLGLSWHSSAEDVLARLGPGALEEVACPVCGGASTKRLLTARGFCLVRCLDCFHVYVNPRLRGALQARIAAETVEPVEDAFLEVQKLYADSLCRRLHAQTAGPRLLDAGFGRGYLMQVARAYGFEVFGVDGSPALLARQEPFFGPRLARCWLGDGPLPWGSFDVIVLSHVVEHLPDPRPALARVRQALNREGLVYVAVPDMGSVQFRLLARRWNAIQPLVHYQYFNRASLTRLLEDAGFEVVEAVEHPPFAAEVEARWMALFRQLGGSESGELALLARRREGPAAAPAAAPAPAASAPAP